MAIRPQELQKLIKRRAVVFGGVQAAAGFALLSRLYVLQFVHGDEFKLQAEGNRVKLQLLMPPRGLITDRYGTAMAMNQVNYRLVIEPDNRISARATLKVLADLMQLSPNEVKFLTDAIRVRKVGIPIQVREHLTWEEVARIQYHHAGTYGGEHRGRPVAALSVRRSLQSPHRLCRQGLRRRNG